MTAKPNPCVGCRQPKLDEKYFVEFATNPTGDKVTGTFIHIGQHPVADTDLLRVDLAAHPLYPQLERYVLANLDHGRGKLSN